MKTWYFEDFAIGDKMALGSHIFTEEEIIRFASQFDPQPFHIDKEAAEHSIYGGIIASGWHTCSVVMRLTVDLLQASPASLGSPGIDQIRWIKPVRGGDTISVINTIVDAKPSTHKPDRGTVWTESRVTNQHEELVATIKGMAIFLRRSEDQ